MTRKSITQFRLPLFIRVVALYALVSPMIWLGYSLQQPTVSTASTIRVAKPAPFVKFEKSTRLSGEPVRIQIPRLGVELGVIDGEYDQSLDSWTLSDTEAQFARMTELPNNETGNTFIYGHNTSAVFAPLAQLQTGDEAIISTANGRSFVYRLNGNQIVNPDATSILAPSETPILTLMTCEGIFSEARRVAIFDFKEVL